MVEGRFILKRGKEVEVVIKRFEAFDQLMNYKLGLTDCVAYKAFQFLNYGKRKTKEEREFSRSKKKELED